MKTKNVIYLLVLVASIAIFSLNSCDDPTRREDKVVLKKDPLPFITSFDIRSEYLSAHSFEKKYF